MESKPAAVGSGANLAFGSRVDGVLAGLERQREAECRGQLPGVTSIGLCALGDVTIEPLTKALRSLSIVLGDGSLVGASKLQSLAAAFEYLTLAVGLLKDGPSPQANTNLALVGFALDAEPTYAPLAELTPDANQRIAAVNQLFQGVQARLKGVNDFLIARGPSCGPLSVEESGVASEIRQAACDAARALLRAISQQTVVA